MTMSLKAIQEGEKVPGAVTAVGRGNLRAPKIGTAGFMRQATGTGTYDTSLTNIIENSVARHASYAAKQDMYRTAQAEGIGQWAIPGRGPDGYTEFKDINPAKGTQENERGETSFYVQDAAAKEWREMLAPDAPTKLSALQGVNGALNWATLQSTVEAVYHSKNLMTMLMNPGVNIVNLVKNGIDLVGKDPAAMERLVELARIGVSMPSPKKALSANPFTWMGNGLHFLRESMILTADDAFTKLAGIKELGVVDSEANRRNFINQLGQYNIKGQSKIIQLLRDTGFGPFATASAQYAVEGVKSLTGSSGLETTSLKGQALLRAWKLGKIASVLGTVAAVNFLLHQRVDGDDNTPIGAIKTGVNAQGKTQYFDLLNLTGLTRGLRETGLLALAEGVRQGRPAGAIGDTAVTDALHALIHPAMGPPVQFAHTFMTGLNSLGARITPRNSTSRAYDNAIAAIENVNPLVASLGGFNRAPDTTNAPSGAERAWSLLGPYGLHARDDLSRHYQALNDVEGARNAARSQGQLPG